MNGGSWAAGATDNFEEHCKNTIMKLSAAQTQTIITSANKAQEVFLYPPNEPSTNLDEPRSTFDEPPTSRATKDH